MFTDQQLTTAKAVPIVAYLQSIGHLPVKETGGQLVYFSPKNTEASPSFYVQPNKNVFNDYSGAGERGDVVRLVQILTGCTFREAITTLLQFDGSTLDPSPPTFSFSGQTYASSDGQTGTHVTNVRPLQHAALWQYVESRGITPTIARAYLKEVYYENNGKQYFAVGFANDGGGYALRSKLFKNVTTPNTITTFEAENNESVNVFEGFFDFLAACVHFGQNKPSCTTIVLNSTSNLSKAAERLKTAKKVNVFLDNDKAGQEALQRIAAINPNVVNRANIYHGHKDFNEYVVKK